ncbi:N-acetylmuramoyl-L-alanine amidase [Virgibacillus natechei]|uniref:N-acetylmuramoyl-L-alanine amidase n=1 Tax=Virgibacillus natechei TaxID=1216297 RepID=A0ABS4ICU6_9BACI|nr:N-acetylmuramoyl-L-alanine amidase [Virgibacillus natechei]MBP1968767.1 N-acetylmuramoyl-L-alanine amidase [Virgibacillus natechei]UZD11567.1 N-acetylmuramoyl-L-alanine amidase [Virgibacillus natechei]
MRLKMMITGLISILCLLILLSIPTHADEAEINVDNLNIRSGPGTDFDTVGQADIDQVYTVINKQDEWVEVELDDGTGWITTEYITLKSEPEDFTEMTITIQHDNTQFRNGPSTDYEIIHFADTGTTYNAIDQDGDWYEVEHGEANAFVLKQLVDGDKYKSSSDFTGKTIVIDAGHGGRDVGAIGASDTYEKDFTYQTAQELANELTTLGAEVLLTRPYDDFISLGSRASFANTMDTDVFLSLHYDSIPELPNVTGTETFYYHDQDEELAEYVQEEIINETGTNDRGTNQEDLMVIRQTLKPSILLELGFLSNTEEEERIETNSYQKQMVTGIVNGLRKYFANE